MLNWLAFILFQVNLITLPDSIINSKPDLHAPVKSEYCYTEVDSLNWVIEEIVIAGNKTTRNTIIERELLFNLKDTLSRSVAQAMFERSKNNLFNTSLFSTVNIDYVRLYDNHIKVIILVNERWYFWPFPLFELADRNINAWLVTRDLSRTNIGLYLVKLNFRGNKESIVLRFKYGFTRQIGLSYNMPFINKNQRSGLGFGITYSNNKQIILNTIDNKIRFYKDFDSFTRQEWLASIAYTYRQGFYNTHALVLKYTNCNIEDTIADLNPLYFGENRTNLEYFSLDYTYRSDHRDYKAYPLNGYYFEFNASQNGFNIMPNESVNMAYLTSTIKKYWKLGGNLYAGASLKSKLSNKGFQPFYMQRALGYTTDYIRSYEYYAIDGQHFVLSRNNFKYNIIKGKTIKLVFLGNSKLSNWYRALYINAFVDAGYVWDKQFDRYNSQANQLQYGYGLGIDYVSSNDLVVRVEYAFNKYFENGFFFHLSAPI